MTGKKGLIFMTAGPSNKTTDLERFVVEEETETFAWDNNRNVTWMECGDPKGFPSLNDG